MIRTEDEVRAFYAELSVSDEIEQRLQRWAAHLKDPVAVEPSARSRRPTVIAIAAAVAAVAVVALVAGILASRTHPSGPEPRPPAVVSASDTFVTVAQHSGQHAGYAVQLRRTSDGAVVRTVLRTGPNIRVSTAQTADGQLLVALTRGCATTLKRIDPSTGRTSTVRTIDETVAGTALSPDGTRLAYLTHPNCVVRHCATICAGLQQYSPNVLVVLDLASGRSARTATDDQRHPLFGLSWSPDGHRIVAGYEYGRQKLLIFNAANPNFHTAQHVANPPRCSYFAPSWTKDGIVAAEGCRQYPGLSPSRIVEINPGGAVSARWPLPRCIDGVDIRTDPAHERVLVQTNIGYGNGSCGTDWATRISRINGTSLHTILNVPGGHHAIELDG